MRARSSYARLFAGSVVRMTDFQERKIPCVFHDYVWSTILHTEVKGTVAYHVYGSYRQGCGSRDLVLVSRPIKTTFLRSWSCSWSRPCWSWSRSWSRRVVLSKTWGYVQPQRYLCRKSKLASECAPLFIYLLAPHLAVSNSYLIYTTTLRTSRDLVLVSRTIKTTFWGLGLGLGLDPVGLGLGLGLGLPGLGLGLGLS